MQKIKKHIYIIIPCYNEKKTIIQITNKICKLKKLFPIRIIVINDGSNDGTEILINKFLKKKIFRFINLKKNFGKGYAINKAKKYIKKNSIIIIQDADLEYYPKDLVRLIKYKVKYNLKAIYGSRFLKKNFQVLRKQFLNNYIRIIGNIFLTKFSNLINKQNLTDAHTCYKIMSSEIFKKIKLQEKGFGFCAEINTKLSNLNINIKELPIKYKSRSYEDGKKITFKDAFNAIFSIIYYKIFKT